MSKILIPVHSLLRLLFHNQKAFASWLITTNPKLNHHLIRFVFLDLHEGHIRIIPKSLNICPQSRHLQSFENIPSGFPASIPQPQIEHILHQLCSNELFMSANYKTVSMALIDASSGQVGRWCARISVMTSQLPDE